ncbi:MAG: hypothetical protein KC468_11790, partial [Myxococcales bacterium]|nr:hypothetical protein [Myxococcales bacterium]
AIVGPIVVAMIVAALIHAVSASARPWYGDPSATRLALLSACLLGLAPALSLAELRADARALAGVTWVLWSALGLLLALTIPGVSVVFTVPAVAGVLGLALAHGAAPASSRAAIGLALGPCLVALLWTQLAYGLEQAFGLGAPMTLATVYALALAAMTPTLALAWTRPRTLTAALAVVTLALALHASRQPEFTDSVRQPLNITLAEDHSQTPPRARWIASAWGSGETLPAALRQLAPFERERLDEAPWDGRTVHAAPAEPSPKVPPASLETLQETREGELRVLRVRLRASHGVGAHWLSLPAARLAELSLVTPTPRVIPPELRGDQARLTFFGVPDEGVELVLRIRGAAPVDVAVVDAAYGLPERAAALARARDATAMPRQFGDMHLITTITSL